MNEREIIRTVRIKAEVSGVDETKVALKGLAGEVDNLNKTSEKTNSTTVTTARQQASVAEAFARAERKVSPAARALQEFERIQRLTNMAIGQNPSLVDRANALLGVYADRLNAANAAQERVKQSAPSINSAENINARLGVNDNSPSGRSQDVAAYGRALDDLRAKYSPLYAAGRQYKETLTDINAAARLGAITETERSAAISRTKEQFAAQVVAMRNAGKQNVEFADSSKRSANAVQNLSYQLNDVLTGLVTGQSPLMIMGQQSGQVMQVLTGGARTVQTALLGMGAVAVVAGIVAVTTVLSNLRKEMADTADTAKRSNISSDTLQGIQAAAGRKGMDPGELNAAMVGFNRQVDEARDGVGSLSALLRANDVAARDSERAFFAVADLVANAKTEAQKFNIAQQAGLPATTAMIKILEQGSTALRQQVAEAQKFTAEQLEHARQVEERWNEMWQNFSRYAKAAILEGSDFPKAGSPLGDLIEMAKGNKPWSIKFDLEFGVKEGSLAAGLQQWLLQKTGRIGTATIPAGSLPTAPVPAPIDWTSKLGGYRDGVDGAFSHIPTTQDVERQRQLEALERPKIGWRGAPRSVIELIAEAMSSKRPKNDNQEKDDVGSQRRMPAA